MFKKGDPKPPGSGRKKGTPNKGTVEIKRFFRELLTDEAAQARMLAMHRTGALPPQVLTLACYYVLGKPRDQVQINVARLTTKELEQLDALLTKAE